MKCFGTSTTIFFRSIFCILTVNTVWYRLRLEYSRGVLAGVELGDRRAVGAAGWTRQHAAGGLTVAEAVVAAVES